MRILVALLTGFAALVFANGALAGGPSISSDQADYAPGSTVTLTGSGWGTGESVHVTVDDTLGQTWSWASNPDPLVGLDGSFTVTLTLPNTFIASYTVNASGSSGAAASTTFTDGNVTSVSGTVTDSVTHNPIAGATVKCDSSSGCNATFTTTTDASGAYTFSSTKLTFAGNGPVTLTLGVSKTGYASGTITLTNVNNGNSFTNKDVALTPTTTDQAPLSVTGPSSATFGAADQAITTSGGSGMGAVTFSAGGSTACSISGSNLHVTSGTGTCTITANKAGDANFNPATSAPFSVTINKASQTVAFTSSAPSAAAVGGAYHPTATGGGSANAVTFGASGACSYNASTQLVNMDAVGTCTVTADQLGNDNYQAAAQATQSFSVGKGSQTIAVTTAAPANAPFGAQFTVAATATSGLAVRYSSGGSCSNVGSTFTITSGSGSCTVKFDQAGDTNWNAAPQITETVVAVKASATLSFVTADLAQTFDGTTKSVGVTTTPSGLSGLAVTYSQAGNPATPKDSGSYTVSASLDDPNYAAAPISDTLQIGKAPSTTTVTCPAGPYTYTGDAHTPCSVSVSGAGGLELAPAADYSNNVGAGTATASYTYVGDANHDGSDNSATFEIGKADSTTEVTCPTGPFTYTGLEQTPCAAAVTGAGGLSMTPDPSYTGNTNAGVASASYSYAGDANHKPSDDFKTFTIDKAHLTVTADPAASTYGDPAPSSLGATLSGFVNGEDASVVTGEAACVLSTPVPHNAGTYSGEIVCTVGTLAADNYDFPAANFVAGTYTVRKAHLTVSADPMSITYGDPAPDASALTATPSGFVSGDDMSVVSGKAACSLLTAPSAAGAYPGEIVCSVGTLAADNYDFPAEDFVAGTYTIEKAHLTVTADPAWITYGDPTPDASALTATITGFVNHEDRSVVSGAADCSLATPVPTDADAYPGEVVCTHGNLAADNYDFPDKNFVAGTYTIRKAESSTTVACPASVTFTGSALTPCTVSVTGAGGLDDTPDPVYADNTNAGTASASYSYDGDANHLGSHDSATFTIDKASSTTSVSCPSSVTYTGSPLTPCTVSVTGAGKLSESPTPTYSNNTDAGTAGASYEYAGDANHLGSDDSATFTIDKADSTTTVTCPGRVTYTGSPLTPCTVSVTGAGDLSLAPDPDYADNTDAGTATASYAYAGDSNHNGSSDSKTFTIDKAPSKTAVLCPTSVNYTAAAQTPCTAAVTGAGGLNQALTVAYTSNTGVGTATASAEYAGDANHDLSSDSETFKIVYGSAEVQFLQPINGTAHNLSTNPDVSTFKAGSTVPVKVQVKLPNGTILRPASAVWLTPQKLSATSQVVDESLFTDPASYGLNFAWDSSGLFYQYNWGTPKTGGGFYYLIGVKLDDGQTYTVYISLR